MSAVDHTLTHTYIMIEREHGHTRSRCVVYCICVVVLRWLSYWLLTLLAWLPDCLLTFAYSVFAHTHRWQFLCFPLCLPLSFSRSVHSQHFAEKLIERSHYKTQPNTKERIHVVSSIHGPLMPLIRLKLHMWNCVLQASIHSWNASIAPTSKRV